MDSQTKARCKKAIRDIWTWSQTYNNLIEARRQGRGKYSCENCGKLHPKAKMYIEHIKALELHDYQTLEEYYLLMRDTSNLQVWGSPCCKDAKDATDKEKIKEKKKSKKSRP